MKQLKFNPDKPGSMTVSDIPDLYLNEPNHSISSLLKRLPRLMRS